MNQPEYLNACLKMVSDSMKPRNICPTCKADRDQLRIWQAEPHELASFGGRQSQTYTWQRSENHQKAVELIAKCPDCQEYFKQG